MPVPLLCKTMRFYRLNVLHQGLKIGIFDQFLRQKVNEHNGLILLKSIYCIKRGVYTQKSKRSCEYTDLTAKIKEKKKKKKRGKIQGDGRKFLDSLKSYLGSQISSQSLNEVQLYRLQPKSATKGDFLHIFLSLIVSSRRHGLQMANEADEVLLGKRPRYTSYGN